MLFRFILPHEMTSRDSIAALKGYATMRLTLLRLAESITAKPLNLREASATLLPPKPYASQSFFLGAQI